NSNNMRHVLAFPGFDGILHMSNAEVKDPSRKVLQSMVWGVVINAVLAIAFTTCLLFTIGDLDAVLATSYGYPIIEIMYQATRPKAGATALIMLYMVAGGISLFSCLVSVSRLTWAFARDRGLPFSTTLAYVHLTLLILLNSLWLVSGLIVLLQFIIIGSTSAFFAVLSLVTISLYFSQIFPILFLVLRKLRGAHPAYGPWHLGRWGLPINLVALAYATYITIFLPFPPFLPVMPANMNYAGSVLGFFLLLALEDWFVSGHSRFRLAKTEAESAYPED
ncbi:hypothetical protein W97_09161, partial [Coniosporium apollinis CBS 100218]